MTDPMDDRLTSWDCFDGRHYTCELKGCICNCHQNPSTLMERVRQSALSQRRDPVVTLDRLLDFVEAQLEEITDNEMLSSSMENVAIRFRAMLEAARVEVIKRTFKRGIKSRDNMDD